MPLRLCANARCRAFASELLVGKSLSVPMTRCSSLVSLRALVIDTHVQKGIFQPPLEAGGIFQLLLFGAFVRDILVFPLATTSFDLEDDVQRKV